ncbi:alkene reductase [Agrobacterium genomosp. 3 str. CIP 111-78]|uniref:Alkene reductase n=1 Tax=Agrobacterium tumefaciens TaxID=358 RepID=A0AAE6BQN4_AGRTU|nr:MULTISPECIES: alkene reductase [Agrobacterium tumefaciens complex]MCA2372063.1 alkene reductase [Agrobacterium tomkonis CIP 111-78]QCM02181.1 alkene reductase [Agrobacterium tumefaciens]
MTDIWTRTRIGAIEVSNRLAMAPMTRSRAQYDGTPGPLAAEYYSQRASLGLIITEGTQPSDDGQGYTLTPGIYTDAHVRGWKEITDAVHAKDSHIFIQLMHVGRTSHPDNTPHHRQALAPSAIAPKDQIFTPTGFQAVPEPREMSADDIHQAIADFRYAGKRAIEAGADGVEIHGANGYLIQQFFAPNANRRTDAFGGRIENRARFAIEVAKAVADEIGPERTGIRLSPGATLGGLDEGSDGPDLYRYLVGELDKLGLAYVHVMHLGNESLLADIRKLWHRALIVNRPGRALADIGADIVNGLADIESYGQFTLANPDFPERLKKGANMNPADRMSYFGGDAKGFIDYPTLEQATA